MTSATRNRKRRRLRRNRDWTTNYRESRGRERGYVGSTWTVNLCEQARISSRSSRLLGCTYDDYAKMGADTSIKDSFECSIKWFEISTSKVSFRITFDEIRIYLM
jgi:hypothetical protein